MSEENKSVPFGAYEGGAKVLSAIKEVLEHGGPIEKAIANGEAALRDLRPSLPPIPVYRHTDATDEFVKP